MITINLNFSENYYSYIARKYRVNNINDIFTGLDDELFCKKWIKEQKQKICRLS